MEAGRRLCEVRAQVDGPAGDRISHLLIRDLLAGARPDDAVLSEEGLDDEERQSAQRVWIVDPVDGTREFAEAGRVDWAVHVALWARRPDGSRQGQGSGGGDSPASGGDLVAGAVSLPAENLVFSTAEAPVVPPPVYGSRLRMVVSRSRPPALVGAVAAALDMEVVPHGSAGAKAMEVVRGRADAYLHAGGQYEWDSAAPVAVARAAGLHASRIDGSPLLYNRPDPLLPDILVCRPELAAALLEAIAATAREA